MRLLGGLVRVWSSSSRVELGDFAKVAVEGFVPEFLVEEWREFGFFGII